MKEQAKPSTNSRKIKRSRYIRINFFFFLVFLLFVALIVRLGIVQIVQGEEFAKEVAKTDSDIASLPAPRGKMYDRYNRVVVDNVSVPAITYTVNKATKTSDKIKTAKMLAQYIQYDEAFLKKEVQDRDIKDYWLAAHPKEAEKLLTKKELKLEGKETYKLQVERVPTTKVEAIKNNLEQLELAYLYKRFSSGYQYEPQVVKSKNINGDEIASNLTDDEISAVSERLEELPGVDVITDWGRSYPYESLKSIFGGLTSPEQGILESREEYYLARGYSRNDRVGKSYLEYQYEEYLNPQKAKVEYVADKSGNIVSEQIIDEGQRGYDLKLSFDMELQMKVEEIIEEELRAAKKLGANYLMDRAFVVMMDPHNGDVLTMAGKLIDLETGEMNDYPFGAFTTQYEIGSTIKGATVLAGYQYGIPQGQSFYDAPILLKDTPPKKSYMNMGSTDDLKALKLSSNVYMFHVAMEIAGIHYVPNGPFPASDEDFQTLRNYYAQFGLGVPTEIDLPNESKGLVTEPDTVGKLLDIAIGQYDTYTPLQMAQYVSAIANGGFRVQPRVVTSIHEPIEENELGPIAKERTPKILNKINNTQSDFERVQKGFKLVTTTGTAKGKFKLDVAGKTGTSETLYYGPKKSAWGKETNNLNFVGYYPSEEPKIAFSVVVPWAGTEGYTVNKNIANRIVNAYADLQKKYVTTTEINENENQNEKEEG